MLLTNKGKKIMKAMTKNMAQKEVKHFEFICIYASRNKGKIKGVEKAAMGRAMFKELVSKASGKGQKTKKLIVKKKRECPKEH